MIRELFRVERLPVLQNRTFATAAEGIASPVGDVVLGQDDQTGLIANAAFDPSLLRYDRHYQNEQACSTVFKRHLDTVTEIVARHFRDQRLIEVGCGKGYFLEHLRGLGYAITGIDPAYEGDNPDVIRAAFEPGLGLSADGIILRHVLEHIADPARFLRNIAEANGGRGAIYIEVPCFDWIRTHRSWFDIFYEHVNYFRPSDFARMFGRVLDAGHVFGGQYQYVVADLASLRPLVGQPHETVSMPADFLSGVDRAVSIIRNSGRRTAVWGAASKGVVFSLYLKRAGVPVDLVVDINPVKQGRYLPCTGLRVCAPDEAAALLQPGDNMFVMNSNYLDEIISESQGRYTYHTVDHEQL